MSRVIIVGGGLAGMSAAHTVVQNGGRVLVLDKMPFCGGNSTKATSGINAAGSRTQRMLGIPDDPAIFEKDTSKSAAEGARGELIRVLTYESGPAVDWLMDSFGLDLTVVSRLAAHTHPRTHRGKERFPGMMITFGLMEKLEEISETNPERAQVVNKATVTNLVHENGRVVGVEFTKNGNSYKEYGPVIICTGGFGADFSESSLLATVEAQWRQLPAFRDIPSNLVPPLRSLSTTNGPHCTGDGIKLATEVGGGTFDLHCVQVHPTGLVDPADPGAKVKFLAAEALRGAGGLLLDRDGNRFCDELGKRDYVTGRMWRHNKGPYRLVLNHRAVSEIHWHCEHYKGRGLMKEFKSGAELAAEMGIPVGNLDKTFKAYVANASPEKDPWGKKFFHNLPVTVNDGFHVAQVMPLVHYTMGGIACNGSAEILKADGTPIEGLFGGGEVLGGIHGTNRLGGSSLLDCVVYGRVAGKSACRYMLDRMTSGTAAGMGAGAGAPINIQVTPRQNGVTLDVTYGPSAAAAGAPAPGTATPEYLDSGGSEEDSPVNDFYGQGFSKKKSGSAPAPASGGAVKKSYTAAEVAKHNSDDDCWVIIDGNVYDVTEFLSEHPGGKRAITMYAGRDATKEFNMLHKPSILKRHAQEYLKGPLAASSEASAAAAAPAAASKAASAPSSSAGPRKITVGEVAQHKSSDDCWVIINNKVYDVTDFLEDHPGGKRAIMMYAGRDASKEFNMLHSKSILRKYGKEMLVGELDGANPGPSKL